MQEQKYFRIYATLPKSQSLVTNQILKKVKIFISNISFCLFLNKLWILRNLFMCNLMACL